MTDASPLARIRSGLARLAARGHAALKAAWRWPDLMAVAAVVIVLLHGRWASIVFPLSLNPDESEAAANALRIKAVGFNWDALDGSTDGPLDSLAICWPHLFGWDATLGTTRLTGCILLILVCVCVYLSVKALSSRGYAALLTLPLMLFYAFTTDADFVHYSSELLPVCLLAAANCLVIGISADRLRQPRFETAKFALLGLILGAVPFAKLQAAPLGVIVGLYGFYLAVTAPSPGRLRKAMALIGGGLAPACGFLLPLLASGHIRDFWLSYIAYAFMYVRAPLPIAGIHDMIAGDLLLQSVTYFMSALILAAGLHAGFAAWKGGAVARKSSYLDLAYGALMVAVAFWVIAKPGNPFLHYLAFFPPFLVVLCGCCVRVFAGRKRDGVLFAAYYGVLALVFIGFAAHGPRNPTEARISRQAYIRALDFPLEVRSPRMLSWLPFPAANLLVWGWMPQWYVWSGLTPSSRVTNTYLQIAATPLQGYFRSRFMADIGSAPPDAILDGVEGRSFFYSNPAKYGPAIFPEFAAYLSQHYVQLPPWRPEPDCPKLYIKDEYQALYDRQVIQPASVTASATYQGDQSPYGAAKLFDNSVTEDTCTDYWLLPMRTPGDVDVRFAKVEPVLRVMLLNTQDSDYLDRAADGVEVKLLKAGVVVADKQFTMRSFPAWTSVAWDAPVASDEMRVYILSYLGRGGGLNEIKIFRP